jgi:hypothetical protein
VSHPEWSCRELGAAAGCSHNVAWRTQRTVREYLREVMAANASVALTQWAKASRAAARRGDHTAAMEWLQYAQLLDVLPTRQRGSPHVVRVVNGCLPGLPGYDRTPPTTIEGEMPAALEGPPSSTATPHADRSATSRPTLRVQKV